LCTAVNTTLSNLFPARRSSPGEKENVTHTTKNWQGKFETQLNRSACINRAAEQSRLPYILAIALGIFRSIYIYIYIYIEREREREREREIVPISTF
jgi:hypothetical protein